MSTFERERERERREARTTTTITPNYHDTTNYQDNNIYIIFSNRFLVSAQKNTLIYDALFALHVFF